MEGMEETERVLKIEEWEGFENMGEIKKRGEVETAKEMDGQIKPHNLWLLCPTA